MPETYLNHPTFGLLTRICEVDEKRALFTTLYAQRLFFVITNSEQGVRFEPVSRSDAKLMVENRLRFLRRSSSNNGAQEELHKVYKRTFY